MQVLIAMFMFSFTMSFSPGPVNFIALSCGVNVGFWRTQSFVIGATVGFIIMLFFIGLGVGVLIEQVPFSLVNAKYLGCLFICYMGVKAWFTRASYTPSAQNASHPYFVTGVLMQWLNPKAWGACIAGCTAFNVYQNIQALTVFSLVYFTVCYSGIASWSFAGELMQRLLSSPHSVAIFNKLMGVSLCIIGLLLAIS